MSIIIMILLLSILVLVHEAGHFFAAKMFKMKVSAFGFGLPIGPTLWEKQVGDLTLRIHAFLLGGYVSFPDDEPENKLPKDSPDRFANRPVYQRFVVISAGVLANVICAFVIVLLTALLWGQLPSNTYDIKFEKGLEKSNISFSNIDLSYNGEKLLPLTDSLTRDSEELTEYLYRKSVSPSAEASGAQKGDKIIKINGSDVTSRYALRLYAMYSAKNDGKITQEQLDSVYKSLKSYNHAYERDEIILKDSLVKLPPQQREEKIYLDNNVLKGVAIYQDEQIQLNEKQKNIRDSIKNPLYWIADGESSLNDIAYALADNVHPLDMTVERMGQRIDLNTIYPNEAGLIGISYIADERMMPVKGFFSAIGVSYKYLYNETSGMLVTLKQLFTGKIPLKYLHSIVVVTKIGGNIIDNQGIFYGLLLTAMISMNLAIFNFLPIPALDGGHALFLILEKILGKPVDERVMERISSTFFMMLILLMVFMLCNDFYVIFTQKI